MKLWIGIVIVGLIALAIVIAIAVKRRAKKVPNVPDLAQYVKDRAAQDVAASDPLTVEQKDLLAKIQSDMCNQEGECVERLKKIQTLY